MFANAERRRAQSRTRAGWLCHATVKTESQHGSGVQSASVDREASLPLDYQADRLLRWQRPLDSAGQEKLRSSIAAASGMRDDCPLGGHLAGSGKLEDGWFYNPDDGETYSVTEEIQVQSQRAYYALTKPPGAGTTHRPRCRMITSGSDGLCFRKGRASPTKRGRRSIVERGLPSAHLPAVGVHVGRYSPIVVVAVVWR